MKLDGVGQSPQVDVATSFSGHPDVVPTAPAEPPAVNLQQVARFPRNASAHAGASGFGASLHQLELLAAKPPMLARLEARFDALFATTGFDDLEELDAAIDALGPHATRLRDMIRDERVAIASHQRVSSRDSIVANGFLTTHTGGEQRGAVEERIAGEAKRYAMSPEAYAALPAAAKPIYGLLRPDLDSEIDAPFVRAYGEDVYVLNTSAVRDSLTFHLEDSGAVSDWDDDNAPAQAWHELFIPWKYRSLMVVPLLHNVVEQGAFHVGDFRKRLPEQFAALGESVNGVIGYIEIQKCGATNLDDVETFIFHTEPPSGPFLVELKRRGISILDGREDPSHPVPWAGR